MWRQLPVLIAPKTPEFLRQAICTEDSPWWSGAIAEGTEAAARIDESLMGYTGL